MELLLSKCEQDWGMSFLTAYIFDDFNFDCFLTKKDWPRFNRG